MRPRQARVRAGLRPRPWFVRVSDPAEGPVHRSRVVAAGKPPVARRAWSGDHAPASVSPPRAKYRWFGARVAGSVRSPPRRRPRPQVSRRCRRETSGPRRAWSGDHAPTSTPEPVAKPGVRGSAGCCGCGPAKRVIAESATACYITSGWPAESEGRNTGFNRWLVMKQGQQVTEVGVSPLPRQNMFEKPASLCGLLLFLC